MSASFSHSPSIPLSRRLWNVVTGQAPGRGGAKKGLLDIWWERRTARLRLAEMSDHNLQDIGLTREDALKEAEKPFWMA